jgi:hypothetical protein
MGSPGVVLRRTAPDEVLRREADLGIDRSLLGRAPVPAGRRFLGPGQVLAVLMHARERQLSPYQSPFGRFVEPIQPFRDARWCGAALDQHHREVELREQVTAGCRSLIACCRDVVASVAVGDPGACDVGVGIHLACGRAGQGSACSEQHREDEGPHANLR